MGTVIRKIVGGYMFLMAVTAAVSLPAKMYFEHEPELSTWAVLILNSFMALGILFALITCVRNKIALAREQDDIREYLEVNLSFYGTLILAMWFFANWVSILWSAIEFQLMWWFIYPLLVIIFGANGIKLWRTADSVKPFPANTWFGPRRKKLSWRLEFQKLLASILQGFGSFVGAYLVIYPPILIDQSSRYPDWIGLEWIMGTSVVIVIVYCLKEKQQLKQSQADIRKFLETNTLFYAVIVLVIMFLTNWLLNILATSEHMMWWFICALFAVTVGCSGFRMYNNANQKQLELDGN